jgi:diketogulonate reductase-like aldo/keto reductase
MALTITSTVPLNNGVEMPLLGLGVYLADDGEQVESAVTWALEAGYRHVDTASIYKNEEGVGRAIAASDVDRSDVFVTTKVWNDEQGLVGTMEALDRSLGRLGMDYVDLYLVHWPRPHLMEETWQAMESIVRDGKARAIGVSNFLVHHLEQLFEFAELLPAVNQVEFHPHLQQPELVRFCEAHEIRVEAWSPLKRGQVLDMPELVEIGERHGKSAVQVTVRWMLQRGIITIPKSVKQDRVISNADVYDFELSAGEAATIDALDTNDRTGPHPDFFP